MLKLLIPLLSVLHAINSVSQYGLPEVDNIGILDTNSFDEFLSARKNVLVLFFSPQDTDLSFIMNEYSQLSKKVSENKEDIPVVLVDLEAEPELKSKLGSSTVTPKIIMFTKEKTLEYTKDIRGNLLYDWAVQFILKKKDNNELKTIEEIRRVSKMRFAVVLKFPSGDSEQLNEYYGLAKNEPETAVYYTNIDSLLNDYNTESKYALILFRNFDDGMKIMSGDQGYQEKSMRQFVNMFKTPTVYPFDKEVINLVYSGNTTVLIYFAKNFTAEQNNTFQNFAFQNRFKIKIYMCEFSDFGCQNLAFSVGHEEWEKQSVFILQNEGKGLKRYKLKTGFSEKSLGDFVDNFNLDLLNPYVKSEQEPLENSSIIQKVVRNTVNRKVLNVKKTVVLIGYTENEDWLKIEPVLEKLAERFTKYGNVDFTKIDVSKNEHDNVFVSKVPQIFVYKKKSKLKPTVYLGKNKEAKIEKFLEQALKEELEEGGEKIELQKGEL